MKRFSTIIFAILLSYCISLGNSAPPSAKFRELLVDSLGNWTVELDLNYPNSIDSIQIGFSSGISTVANFNIFPPDSLTVIDNSNLIAPISVNPEGDYIIVKSWGGGYFHYDSLAFGNYPGSYLNCAEFGDSYAFIWYYTSINFHLGLTIDKTPTMGIENDSSGAVAYFTGSVFDPQGNLITEGTIIFGLEDLYFKINANGTFHDPIFAHYYYADTIVIKSASYPYTFTSYCIQPIEFCGIPGSVIQEDIICTGFVKVDEMIEDEPLMVVSPNPFSSTITFYWEIPELQVNDQVELFIYDQQGKQSLNEMIQPNVQTYKWNPGEDLPSGMYIYHLVKNGESISSGKIIRI
jgi:hypothetical protein